MLSKIRQIVSRRDIDTEEQGSDVVVTLFMIPFVLGLIFALIDVSTYFQTRSQIQNIARDGARQVALYGGQSKSVPLNTTGKDVVTTVKDRVYKNGACVPSGCPSGYTPTVTCGPNKATNLNQDAYCTINYRYRGFGGSLVSWLGFDTILSQQINITEKFKVETQY